MSSVASKNFGVLILAASLLAAFTTSARGEGKKSVNFIQPDRLVKMLSGKSKDRPLVLQVGFEFLYSGGHIPGSVYAGPASSPQGVARLKEAVRNVPVTKEIVVYCGCCPWDECPNVAPAMKTLRALGYKDVKALYIPENFETDWMAKGYPTDSRRSVKGR